MFFCFKKGAGSCKWARMSLLAHFINRKCVGTFSLKSKLTYKKTAVLTNFLDLVVRAIFTGFEVRTESEMFSFKAVLIICILHVCSCYSESDVQITDGVLRELKIFHHSCALKMDEGPCKASKLSFYFNVNTHKCETFLYGGCLGNANNFETLAECEEKCLVTPGKNPCHLEEEPGPCRGVFTRYFFNSSAQKCDRMIYGGCFGNANNFKTLKDCQATCHKKKPHTVEDSDKHTDTKPNIIPVIYFDLTTVNSSSPELDSRRADLDRPDFCWSRPDRGTCDGSMKRYFFNPKKMRCHAFRYSGCGGNKNNFVSKEDCRKTCMKGVPVTGRIRIKKKNIKILVKP